MQLLYHFLPVVVRNTAVFDYKIKFRCPPYNDAELRAKDACRWSWTSVLNFFDLWHAPEDNVTLSYTFGAVRQFDWHLTHPPSGDTRKRAVDIPLYSGWSNVTNVKKMLRIARFDWLEMLKHFDAIGPNVILLRRDWLCSSTLLDISKILSDDPLSGRTANPLCSARVGSNPILVDRCKMQLFLTKDQVTRLLGTLLWILPCLTCSIQIL